MFNRGFAESRKKAKKGIKYIRSCFNCIYYYEAVGDGEEMCQNTNVSEYDLVVDGNNIYCTYWKPLDSKENKFNKTGRDREL